MPAHEQLQPLILTLQIDSAAQAFYEDLRRRYFPPERNLIPAHLTLFHHLPDEPATHHAAMEAAHNASTIPLTKPQLRSLGRGVAVFFDSPPIIALHRHLATIFNEHLTAQDRQPLRPHIVVQNKVTPAIAFETLAALQPLTLSTPQATGLTLWRYLNGPWQHLADFPFIA